MNAITFERTDPVESEKYVCILDICISLDGYLKGQITRK